MLVRPRKASLSDAFALALLPTALLVLTLVVPCPGVAEEAALGSEMTRASQEGVLEREAPAPEKPVPSQKGPPVCCNDCFSSGCTKSSVASWSPGKFPPSKEDLTLLAPGARVTREHTGKVAKYLTPLTTWLLASHGPIDSIEIGPYQTASLPQPVIEATRRYACRVKLDPATQGLVGFVAGLPFPEIDANDPDAGVKLMWNHDVAAGFDDVKVGPIECWAGLSRYEANTSPLLERHFLVDSVKQLRYAGRLMLEPRPALTPNGDDAWEITQIQPLIEPFDWKGTRVTWYRYLGPQRPPDTWLYAPQLRRVRRLTSAQRSDALFGQDMDFDSFGGYAGPIGWTRWKYLGERTVLAPFHAATPQTAEWGYGPRWFLPQGRWELRRVWVIEGRSKLPQYAYSRRVIYLDEESYRIAYEEIYDQAGELWKLLLNSYHFSNVPFPSKPCGADWRFPYLTAETMIDAQLVHATRCESSGEKWGQGGGQGWQINMDKGLPQSWGCALSPPEYTSCFPW